MGGWVDGVGGDGWERMGWMEMDGVGEGVKWGGWKGGMGWVRVEGRGGGGCCDGCGSKVGERNGGRGVGW